MILAHAFPPAFMVTGTDTDVGKTVVSALLTLGLRAAYWKPVQSGLEPYTDTQRVQQLTGLDGSHFLPERFRLRSPLSPHESARRDGVEIWLEDFVLPTNHGKPHLIVEGAGGVLVPLNERDLLVDLIRYLHLPVVLVARSTLGTINHTLLSLEALRSRHIPIFGVILNGPKNPDNRQAIEDYGQVRVLAEIEPLTILNLDTLYQTITHCFPDLPGAVKRSI